MTDLAEQWAEAAISAGRYGVGTMITIPYEQMRSALTSALRFALKEQREEDAKKVEARIGDGCDECVTPDGGTRFCENFGCHTLREIAAVIRS